MSSYDLEKDNASLGSRLIDYTLEHISVFVHPKPFALLCRVMVFLLSGSELL
jgi:hypothetical protein